MAKNTLTNPYVGKDITPPGIMTGSHALRHKIVGFSPPETGFKRRQGRGTFKRWVESTKAYRLSVHGVTERKLANTFRLGLHYLIVPLTKTGAESYQGTTRVSTPSPATPDVIV